MRVERPATGGGIGRAEDGRVVFVRHALPGELVRVAITEATSNFYRGDAVEVVEPSPERVAAPCPYAHPGGCGGCDLQHARREAQLAWKSALVAEQLRRLAGIAMAVEVRATASAAQGSRTRLRCAVDGSGRLGLREARSRELIPLERCWIADERLQEAFKHQWPGAREVELRAIGTGAPLAVVRREAEQRSRYDVRSLHGEVLGSTAHSSVEVRGYTFTIGPRSFWQSHCDAPEVLLDCVLELADVEEGDDVVDLFSGVGLFSVPLARRVGPRGRVTAIDSSPFACRDARDNASGLGQLKVREWSVSPRSVNDAVRQRSVVVLDPPRHGLPRGAVASLARRGPRRLVYVACDAATFARDLKGFLDAGYALSDLRVFDLFPMTEHVEIVSLLDTPS